MPLIVALSLRLEQLCWQVLLYLHWVVTPERFSHLQNLLPSLGNQLVTQSEEFHVADAGVSNCLPPFSVKVQFNGSCCV